MSDRPIQFWQALILLFTGLKLCHQIDWSWLVVMFPLWIVLAKEIIGGIAESFRK